jgi:hypothetical protein
MNIRRQVSSGPLGPVYGALSLRKRMWAFSAVSDIYGGASFTMTPQSILSGGVHALDRTSRAGLTRKHSLYNGTPPHLSKYAYGCAMLDDDGANMSILRISGERSIKFFHSREIRTAVARVVEGSSCRMIISRISVIDSGSGVVVCNIAHVAAIGCSSYTQNSPATPDFLRRHSCQILNALLLYCTNPPAGKTQAQPPTSS